mmetsp:Transcript_99074/g.256141  ORF Transcript_99074/g.256141 Transcript_99074/m.256141 type:complete len:469 (-) Transcript_99074:52-1458(-)
MSFTRAHHLLCSVVACRVAVVAAAAGAMLDTDAAGPACGENLAGVACDQDDVQLMQREFSVKHRGLSEAVAGGVAAARSSADPSSSSTSQCVDIPPGSDKYEDWRGSGKMQRMTSFEESCASWNPSAKGVPARPDGCLGPLEQLVGTWVGSGHAYTYVPTLPFPSMRRQGPSATATPWYNETLVFTPIIGTPINKGYSDNNHLHPGCRVEQALHGVSYTQEIRIGYKDELHQLLHHEHGMIMYNVMPGWDDNWTVGRMGVIPRGITFQSYGDHKLVRDGDVKEQLLNELSAFDLDLLSKDKCLDPLGHVGPPHVPDGHVVHEFQRKPRQGPELADMHDFLRKPVQQASAVESFTKIDLPLSSVAPNSFLQNAAKPTNFASAIFIESLKDQDGNAKQQLQYAQRLDVEFFQRLDCITCPGLTRDETGCYHNVTRQLDQCFVDNSLDPTCSEKPYISWPHVTVNTLTKVA